MSPFQTLHTGALPPRAAMQAPEFQRAGYTPAAPGRPSPALVTLPPYVCMQHPGPDDDEGGGGCVYMFVVPGNVRPPAWPVCIPLGSDGGAGPGAVREKAWSLYSDLLHAMHTQQLALEHQLHPATLLDAIDRFMETPRLAHAIIAHDYLFNHMMEGIIRWSAANHHPPMATITPEHVYAFLMAQGPTRNYQRRLRALLSELYKLGIRHGYTDRNPALGLPLPASAGHVVPRLANLPRDIRIFAAPLPHPEPA